MCWTELQRVANKHSIKVISIAAALYFGLLAAYGITVNVQTKSHRHGLGWLNAFLVFITDAILLGK